MPAACIETPLSRVRLESERIVVHTPPVGGETGSTPAGRRLDIPLAELDRLILSEHVQITSQAMGALLRAKIPVVFTDHHGRTLGLADQPVNKEGAFRLLQYQRTLEPDFALRVARTLVHAKISNQRRLLQKLHGNRPGCLDDEIPRLDGFRTHALSASSFDNLRGFEGSATQEYFSGWSRFLPEEFPFERRSTRPPTNEVNACISFGSVVLYNEMATLLHRRGLDPALGLFHSTANDRYSLALDLLEPFRPAVVEAFTMRLFSHRMLGKQHFESRNKGCFLNMAGRREFFLHLERRMKRKFQLPGSSDRTTMRAELEHQVLVFKRALSNPEEFHAFLIP